jgi:hypothetical protein
VVAAIGLPLTAIALVLLLTSGVFGSISYLPAQLAVAYGLIANAAGLTFAVGCVRRHGTRLAWGLIGLCFAVVGTAGWLFLWALLNSGIGA